MKIYLLKTSQYNESYLLSGYFTNEEEIKNLVRDYCVSYFNDEPENVKVNFTTLEVSFLCLDCQYFWHLVELEKYEGNFID